MGEITKGLTGTKQHANNKTWPVPHPATCIRFSLELYYFDHLNLTKNIRDCKISCNPKLDDEAEYMHLTWIKNRCCHAVKEKLSILLA